MSKKLYEESNIQGIADAIREKNGTQNSYTVAQMGNAVRAIHTDPILEDLSVTENGNYLPSAGKDGFGSVSVDVEGEEPVVQPLNATQNGTYNPPSGVDGYSPVTVNVTVSANPELQSLLITEAGEYNYDQNYDGLYGVDTYKPPTGKKFGTPINLFSFENFKNIPIYSGSAQWGTDDFVLTASGADCYTDYNDSKSIISLPSSLTAPYVLYLKWDAEVLSGNNGNVFLFYTGSESPNISKTCKRGLVSKYMETKYSSFNIRFGASTSGTSIRYSNIEAGYIPIINDPDYIPNVQSLTVNQDGTYTPPSGVDGYAPVTVNVSGCSTDPVIGNWEQGGVNTASGGSYHNVKSPSSMSNYRTRVRTVGMTNLGVGLSYEVTVNNLYKVDVLTFTSDGQYIATSYDDRWQDTFSFTAEHPYMAFMFKKNDDSNVTPSDFGSTGIAIHKINGSTA